MVLRRMMYTVDASEASKYRHSVKLCDVSVANEQSDKIKN